METIDQDELAHFMKNLTEWMKDARFRNEVPRVIDEKRS
jgi:hypothetical protein